MLCLSVTWHIVDLHRRCIRSGVIRCTLFMELYLCRMFQCGLLKVLNLVTPTVRIHVRRLAARPHSIAGILVHSQCLFGTILLTLYSMVQDWRVLRVGPMFFLLAQAARSPFVFYCFNSLFFLSIGWYCGYGTIDLLGCKSLSLRLAFPNLLQITIIIIIDLSHLFN